MTIKKLANNVLNRLNIMGKKLELANAFEICAHTSAHRTSHTCIYCLKTLLSSKVGGNKQLHKIQLSWFSTCDTRKKIQVTVNNIVQLHFWSKLMNNYIYLVTKWYLGWHLSSLITLKDFFHFSYGQIVKISL